MSLSKLFTVLAMSILVALASRADAAPRTQMPSAGRTSSGMQPPFAAIPFEPQAYVEATDLDQAYPLAAEQLFLDESHGGPDEPAPECCGVCGECDECCCDVNYRSGWSLSFDASALQSQMTTRDVDAWPDEFGAAGRITLGYEWESGFGMRTQAWGYAMQGEAFHFYYTYVYNYSLYVGHYYTDDSVLPYGYYGYRPVSGTYTSDVELTAATAYLDFYKSFSSRNGEWLVGAGPAFGHLEFISPPAGNGTAFYGGGVTVFGQGTYSILQRRRWELAFTGQARAVLLTGHWSTPEFDFYYNFNTQSIHNKSMSVLELGVGPEIRYRFGRSADHYWYVRTLAEFQQWRSDEMGPMGGDTLGLQGATVSFGVGW